MLETTLVVIIIAGIAFFSFCIRACYMSKCKQIDISLRGIKIERDTSNEENVSKLHLDIPKVSH